MPMIMRQTLVSVKPGKRQEVERLFDAFEETFQGKRGYILGFRYTIPEQPDVLAHISLWESHQALGTQVIQDHIIYLRSQILKLSDTVKNSDKEYVVHGTTKNFPVPAS